jgi:hypothetical protein
MLATMSEETSEPDARLVTRPPGEMSPDGRYRWDGQAWQMVGPPVAPAAPQVQFPATQHVDMGAGAAFKLGFFAFFGAGCASLIFWVIAVIGISLLGGLGAIGLGALGHST